MNIKANNALFEKVAAALPKNDSDIPLLTESHNEAYGPKRPFNRNLGVEFINKMFETSKRRRS